MATERNAGEARVTLVPDASGFKRRAEDDLKKIRGEFAAQVVADTSRAARELEAFRVREGRNAVNLKVDVDTAGARTQIDALRTSMQGAADAGGGFATLFSRGLTRPAALTSIVSLLAAHGSRV